MTTPAPRCGAIILARHGKPALSRNVILSAQEYRAFWVQYELGGILPEHGPTDRLRKFAAEAGTLVSSTRRRAIESARMLVGDQPFANHEVLIEAPLPPPKVPQWVRMSPKLWGFFSRVWWWYFNHHDHDDEARAGAEARADEAAAMLMSLAAGGDNVVVLAHGFFNHLIGRSLRRQGWKLVESEGYKYWSMRRFERPSLP